MLRSTIFALSAAVAAAGPAGAQFQPAGGDPGGWMSAGVGIFAADNVSDGKSQSTWNFASASSPQYRLSIEKAISNGGGYGLAATYVRAPIQYTSNSATGPCLTECDAEADVMSLALNFHAAGGQGFHQVYGGSVGVTRYGGFQRKSDGFALEPTSAVMRPSITFSYGLGYGLSRRTQVFAVYEYGWVFHSRDGLTGDQRNTLSVRPFRIGLRQGFGNRYASAPGTRRR